MSLKRRRVRIVQLWIYETFKNWTKIQPQLLHPKFFRDPGLRPLHVGVYLTLIQLIPYRYSYQPTCLPFPSAQCEYLFWIRSAGIVSDSFFLRRWDRGRGVHCTVYTEQRGEARAQFRRNNAFFYALLSQFLPKTNVTFVYKTQKSFFLFVLGKKCFKRV